MDTLQTTSDILHQMAGLHFVVNGPFLVADLTHKQAAFEQIEVGHYGMEKVGKAKKTAAHAHEFASFYKSEGLDIEYEGKIFTLPNKALTVVLPGIHHSWIPKQEQSFVGSVDFRHEKQKLQPISAIA